MQSLALHIASADSEDSNAVQLIGSSVRAWKLVFAEQFVLSISVRYVDATPGS